MSTTVSEDSESQDDDGKALGVRFAESRVGEPIIGFLLFVTGSIWRMIAGVGVLLCLVAFAWGEGVMAGILGTFGLSGIFVGLLGQSVLLALQYRETERS